MALTLLLYIRVSGQFHLIVGMLHLFGYDLPETFRKYLLSTSFTDYWRRVNIYWKDFMVKLVYFPVFFRFRKGGQLRAKLIGTVSVFVVTWALHSAQYLFIRGSGLFTFTDIVFWTIFGILMTFNMWQEHVQEAKGVKKVVPTRFRTICSNVATVSVIMVLWSMWDAPTFGDWFDFLAYWRRA
jgi:D-alanyl-lipoteichoic acid acyltransferase DltB (MBOAT superfamily)